MSPASDGRAIRIWDDRERGFPAVERKRESTAFRFSVRRRNNVFYHPMLAVLTRQQAERETFRESILSSLPQSA